MNFNLEGNKIRFILRHYNFRYEALKFNSYIQKLYLNINQIGSNLENMKYLAETVLFLSFFKI